MGQITGPALTDEQRKAIEASATAARGKDADRDGGEGGSA